MTGKTKKDNKFIYKLHHGFTMAELLIVVAIIGILAAFGFVNVYRYQKNLHQTELDDTAKQIYAAAQNHLTVAKASGSWDAYYQPEDSTSSYYGESMQGQGKKAPSDYKIGGSTNDSDDIEKEFNNTDLHDYRYFAVGSSNAAKLQQYFLPKNAIDGTIMPSNDTSSKHSIVIEYDAKTATVYAVWYTDGKNGWFGTGTHYNFTDKDKTDGRPSLNNSAKAKQYRHDHEPQIGYYGGGIHLKANGKVKQPEAEIVNADRLYVRVKDVEKSNNDTVDPTVIIKVEGDESKKVLKNNKTDDLKAVLSEKDNGNNLIWYQNKEFKNLSNSSGATYTCYMLDSVTDGRNGHFATIAKDSELIPGEDLTITVYNVLGTKVKTKILHTNSLFAAISNDTNNTNNEYTAKLKYGRHLQNLSSDVSNLPSEEKNLFSITKAKLISNIDWSKFIETNNKTVENTESDRFKDKIVNVADNSGNGDLAPAGGFNNAEAKYGYFYSIYNPLLTEIDGNNHTISNLKIYPYTSGNDEASGLIGKTGSNPFTMRNLTLLNPIDWAINSKRYGSLLIGWMQDGGTINNCEITYNNKYIYNQQVGLNESKSNYTGFDKNSDVFISGFSTMGMVCGYTQGTTNISDVQVKGTNNVFIWGTTSSPFLGSFDPKDGINKSLTIDNSKVDLPGLRIKTSAENTNGAGGLIGEVRGGIVSISNSSVHAENTYEIDRAAYSGGLIGKACAATNSSPNASPISATVTINNSFVTAKDIEIKTGFNHGSLHSAGGLIGIDLSDGDLTVNDSYIESADEGRLIVQANQSGAGGIVGYVDANAVTIGNCHVVGSGDNDLISGGDGVGGIAGNISCTEVKIDKSSSSIYCKNTANPSTRDKSGAGGLIGSILLKGSSQDSTITNSYVGGRTKNGKYLKGKDNVSTEARTIDRQNIYTNSAGGFIGRLRGGDAALLSINNCYTTASVYLNNADPYNNSRDPGIPGSFIGKVQTVKLSIKNSYSTGTVRSDNNSSAFIGTSTGTLSGTGNQYLNEVYLVDENNKDNPETEQTSLTPVGNTNIDDAVDIGLTGVSASNISGGIKNHKARKYDTSLSANYPYKTVNEFESYGHIGDWPSPVKDGGVLYFGENNWVDVSFPGLKSVHVYYTYDGSDPKSSTSRLDNWNGITITQGMLDQAYNNNDEVTIKIVGVISDNNGKVTYTDEVDYTYYLVRPIYWVGVTYQDKIQPSNWVATVGTPLSDLTFNISTNDCHFSTTDPFVFFTKDDKGNETIIDKNTVIKPDVAYYVKVHLVANKGYGFRNPGGYSGRIGIGIQNNGTVSEDNIVRFGEHNTDLTFETKIDTSKALVNYIEPIPNNIQMSVGQKQQISYKLHSNYTNNFVSDPSVTWSTSDPEVATVDPEGNVTAIGKGNADITITSNDESKQTAKIQIYVN